MNERRDYAAAATALFRRLHRDRPSGDAIDQERLVGAVKEALRARRRRRVAMRWTLASVATAGGLAAAISLMTIAREKPPVISRAMPAARGGEATRALSTGGAGVEVGTRLVSPLSGEVQVGSSDGTSLTLERGSEIRVTEAAATQRFALRHGALRAHVAKLAAGQRFVVNTDDAEVEVHGTRFRVAIVASDPDCGEGTRTRVSVDEGVVSVHTASVDTLVHPGERWPSGCAATASAPTAVRPRVRRPSPGVIGRATATATTARVAMAAAPPAPTAVDVRPAPTPSELAAQNDLFAAGLRAKRGGNTGAALRYFDLLLARYPGSALAESALAQRMALLAAIDPPAAARAAGDYLARFPDGFATVAARRLASTAAP